MSFWQILSMLSYKSTVFINAFFLSLAGFYFHFETKENTISIIKGIGLGNMIMNVLCFDVCLGMNGALETLISQAYGASKKANGSPAFQQEMRLLCGKYLNLARLVNTVFMILPTVILFLFADEILITFFKQNAYISEIAIQYCIICIPGVWAMTQFDATKRFLSAQQCGMIPVFTQYITCVIQIVCCYILVIQLQWGILGISISTNITFVFNMVIQDLFISLYAEDAFKDMWLGWGRTSLEGLGMFLEYAVPSAIIECSHWWALQLLVFLCGYDQLSGKNASQNFSSQTIILSLFTLTFMFPLGVSYSVSGMVGSHLGQKKYEEALRYANVGYACGMGLMALVCTILGYYSESIFRMFETDPQQISKLKKCMWVILVIIMLQASYGILAGVVKGLGLQNRASLITAICHFAIALPLAVFLGTSAVKFFNWQDREYLG